MSLKLSALAFVAACTLGWAQAAPHQTPMPGHVPVPSTTPMTTATPEPQPQQGTAAPGSWKAPVTSSGKLNQDSSLQDNTETVRPDNLSNKNTQNAVKNRPAPKQGGMQSSAPLQPPVVMAPTYHVSRAPQPTFYGGMPFAQIPPAGTVGVDDEER